ncbi:MAG: hypothetical protein R2873_33140 [Caldilineaceae bacterium]
MIAYMSASSSLASLAAVIGSGAETVVSSTRVSDSTIAGIGSSTVAADATAVLAMISTT